MRVTLNAQSLTAHAPAKLTSHIDAVWSRCMQMAVVVLMRNMNVNVTDASILYVQVRMPSALPSTEPLPRQCSPSSTFV